MGEDSGNSLVSSRPSDSALTVSLHPLVLLTASDLITRHRVRQEAGPVVGILLGQQRGQEITVEHAFPVQLIPILKSQYSLPREWLERRIQQFKDVHKAPALDVVGWFSLCPESGPLPEHLPIQQQITEHYNETATALFLAIHPAALAPSETTNRKLPLTIYECIAERAHEENENSMQVDGEERSNLQFRSVPYAIETDETERIAIDYVAKGAGSAAAIDRSVKSSDPPESEDSKGKQSVGMTAGQSTDGTSGQPSFLTTEEEDQIAGIQTRLNSVKMLQSRLEIITNFIRSLPPSYLSDPTLPLSETSPNPEHLSHLRTVQALLTRLSLITPVTSTQQADNDSALLSAAKSQTNDVALVSMLSQLGNDIQGLSELGRKFVTVEQGKSAKSKGKGGFNQGGYPGSDEHDDGGHGFGMRDNGMAA